MTCRTAGSSLVGFVLDPRSLAELVALLPFYVEVLLRSVGFGNTPALKAFRAPRPAFEVKGKRVGGAPHPGAPSLQARQEGMP